MNSFKNYIKLFWLQSRIFFLKYKIFNTILSIGTSFLVFMLIFYLLEPKKEPSHIECVVRTGNEVKTIKVVQLDLKRKILKSKAGHLYPYEVTDMVECEGKRIWPKP